MLSGQCKRSGGARRKRSQARAGHFRNRRETERKVKLIDAYGTVRYVKTREKLNITKHNKVLTALERRALRFDQRQSYEDERDKELFESLLNDDATVSTACESLLDSDEEIDVLVNSKEVRL